MSPTWKPTSPRSRRRPCLTMSWAGSRACSARSTASPEIEGLRAPAGGELRLGEDDLGAAVGEPVSIGHWGLSSRGEVVFVGFLERPFIGSQGLGQGEDILRREAVLAV